MRHTYIVTYDIRDPKRLRHVFKLIKGYGAHQQLSVFECDLNPTELVELRERLSQVIHFSKDQILFINIGPVEGRAANAILSLGVPYEPPNRQCIIT